MKRQLSLLTGLCALVILFGTLTSSVTHAQYTLADDVTLSWTLDPREHPDLFTHGPAFGGRSVLTGMDFDGDGNKEFLFTTDETLAPGGPDPGILDVYLYENTGNDEYEYVWHYSHEPSNSLPPLTYGDIDGDGLWEIYFGIPTINDDPHDLLVFEQNPDGTFPDEPTMVYDYGREGSLDFRPAGFALEDVDGDGDIELVTVSRTGGRREMVVISLLTDQLDAFATFEIEFEVGENVLGGGALYDVDVVDFDGDGQKEIWVNTWDEFSWSIFEATGPDSYQMQADINNAFPDPDPGSFNSHKLHFLDLSGDGDLEMLAPMTNGKLYYLPSTGDVSSISETSWSEVGTFDARGNARGSDVGDLDGNGLIDIVTADGTTETISRMEYDGSGNPADSSSYAWSVLLDGTGVGDRYYPLRITDDLDGDGKKEIVITNLRASEEGQPLILVLESTVVAPPLAAEGPDEVPSDYVLEQNYPNPFNPTTTIEYTLKKNATVSVRIYDLAGRVVATLVDDQMQTAGSYQVEWDATSTAGGPVASGVYFYSLESRDAKLVKKMVLMK